MKLNWNKRKKSEAARKIFRSGVYSAAVTALVLVLVILLNLIVRAIRPGIRSGTSRRRGSTP